MDNKDLLELITKLSQAAVSLPQNNKPQTENKVGSFKEQTTPKQTKDEPKKVDRQKRKAPSTDAIIEMIQAHNALSREIASKNEKTGQ